MADMWHQQLERALSSTEEKAGKYDKSHTRTCQLM